MREIMYIGPDVKRLPIKGDEFSGHKLGDGGSAV